MNENEINENEQLDALEKVSEILEKFTPEVIAQMTDEQLAEFEELLKEFRDKMEE